MDKERIEELLDSENQQLNKLNDMVLRSIEEEKLLTSKLYEEKKILTDSQISDKLTTFTGSWKFIFLFISIILAWLAVNIFFMSAPFDPYPFILLNLVLSTIAAIQAPFIIMSQNRKEKKDRERSINDYMVNLKSEIEIRNLHQKLDLLIAEQMNTLFEIQRAQVELMEEIKNKVSVDALPARRRSM